MTQPLRAGMADSAFGAEVGAIIFPLPGRARFK